MCTLGFRSGWEGVPPTLLSTMIPDGHGIKMLARHSLRWHRRSATSRELHRGKVSQRTNLLNHLRK
eukprot:9834346-Prorocentrum_lima.AAC.1